MTELLEYTKVLISVIGVITIYIAWKQWQTSKQKLILDRFDRRFKVFDEVRNTVISIMIKEKLSYDDFTKFDSATLEADFLFGPEIPEYIKEIRERGIKLKFWRDRYNTYRDGLQKKPEGYDHNEVVNGIETESQWFTEQPEQARRKFKKYLDVSS
jgi:hypothetical protein